MESNIQLDMANCDVRITLYVNFVTNKPKIRPFSVLVQVLDRLS